MPIYTCTTVESTLTADMKASSGRRDDADPFGDQSRPEHLRQRRLQRTARRERLHRWRARHPSAHHGWVRDGHPERRPADWRPRSPLRPRGSPAFPPSGCWSSSRAAQPITRSKAAGYCPRQAKKRHGLPRKSIGGRRARHRRSSETGGPDVLTYVEHAASHARPRRGVDQSRSHRRQLHRHVLPDRALST